MSHNKDNKNDRMKLSKDRLLRSEYDHYRNIGEPDLSQNWLELFTPTIISDLFAIMESCSDNTQKAEYVQQELAQYGFEELGLGTNIYAMWHPAYPGVAFKVALDSAGLADNYNDEVLCNLVNKILVDAGKKPRYTRCLMRHSTGIVSVQERKVLVKTQDRMDAFRGSILKTLRILSEHFLIVDLSPTLFQFNYGIERNGDWCFIDASDLFPLKKITKKLRCTKAVGSNNKTGGVLRCGGGLRYAEDFSSIVCVRCGKEYIPSEFRPNDKEEVGQMANAMMDGLTAKERDYLEAEELAAISRQVYGKMKHHLNGVYGDPGLAQRMVEEESGRTATVMEQTVVKMDIPPEEAQKILSEKFKQDPWPIELPESPPPAPVVEDEDDAEDGEGEPVEIPTPVPARNSIFWDPSRPKDTSAVMDRSGGVEVIQPGASRVEVSVKEPSIDQLRQMHTSFTQMPTDIGGEDEDDEEDGDGVAIIPSGLGVLNRNAEFAGEPLPSQLEETVEEAEEAEVKDDQIIYNTFRDSDDVTGILVCIPPDIDYKTLYEEHGRGIWVSNDGGKTKTLAVAAAALEKLIEQAYDDLEDIRKEKLKDQADDEE
ncbi:MAG: hypothetical protein NC489_09070 [Ruminococcus flavefaciens]|nr:hypothetical protein [Ruminococcus flavefaciens]